MLKTTQLSAGVTVTRPVPAPYIDKNGAEQTSPADTARFNWYEGQPDGLMLDSLLEEQAALVAAPAFNSEEGTWFLGGFLENCRPLPGTGLDELVTGEGMLVFVYKDGVGTCWSNGQVLYTVDPITPAVATALTAGGAARVAHWEYKPHAITDGQAAARSTGTFEVVDPGSFLADYAAGIYGSRDATGAFIYRQFGDDHTFTRATVKNVWNALGKLESVPADVPAINHDPASLRSSSSELSARPGIKTFTLDTAHDYAVGETLVLTDTAGGRTLVGEVLAADGPSVSISVPLRGVTGYGTGSDWAVIRCLGIWIEHTATNEVWYSEDLTAGPWIGSGAASADANVLLSPRGDLTMDVLNIGPGYNDIFYQAINRFDPTVRCEPSFFCDPNGETEVINVETTSGGSNDQRGLWELDLSAVGAGDHINRYHPAVTILEEFKSSSDSTGRLGILFRALSGNALSIGVWGVQMEQREAPTSYMATPGSAGATRAADVTTLDDLSLWFTPSGFTIIAEADGRTIGRGPDGLQGVFGFQSDAGISDRTYVAFRENNFRFFAQAYSAADGPNFSGPLLTEGEPHTLGLTVGPDGSAAAADGNLSGVNGSDQTNAGWTYAYVGYSIDTSRILNGHIRRIRVLPYAVTATELQELTS